MLCVSCDSGSPTAWQIPVPVGVHKHIPTQHDVHEDYIPDSGSQNDIFSIAARQSAFE